MREEERGRGREVEKERETGWYSLKGGRSRKMCR